MTHLQTFQVFPTIPKPLAFLEALSRNIWWSWHYDAVELFRRIDPPRWDEAGRNPIVFSTYISQKRLEELAKDNSFLAHLERVRGSYKKLVIAPPKEGHPLSADSEPSQQTTDNGQRTTDNGQRTTDNGQLTTDNGQLTTDNGQQTVVAYFSMEFGIHESIPLFAGGLGILAGDHLKAASDMGVPLAAVGLLYRQGYFRQFLDHEGWQQEAYPETDFFRLPLRKAKGRSGKQARISLTGPDGEIYADVWKIMVGRIPLFLLDTNLAVNPPQVREITAKLYAGEPKMRAAQEALLGIGGMRALAEMGIHPAVIHKNEGHCTFASLERLAQIMSLYDIDLKTAMEIVPRTTIFTTHTPVAAGHDEFPPDLVRPFVRPLQERLGVTEDEILAYGQSAGAGAESPVSMFVLGVRMAQYCNGVSELHGKVARRMWAHVWPDVPEEEVPITHVTNGVHIASWISHENALLFERYIGPEWCVRPSATECSYPMDSDLLERIDEVYDEELWRAHEMSRSRLIRTCRRLVAKQYERRNAPKAMMEELKSILDQHAMTIGFSRRFASYKRANLLLSDPERLKKILTSQTHPVQLIFAGKAHPKDDEGKGLIKHVIEFARDHRIRHRMVFIEDYDIHIARHLIHGTDVWLNTPRRPLEACGTSGMKAALNGVLNVSVLDGWWCEGYNEKRGWCIGSDEEYSDWDYQDAVESQALYNILENDVIPCFYERRSGGVPTRWVKMMKESIKMGMQFFCAHRMVSEYQSRFYLPAAERYHSLIADHAKEAAELSRQRARLSRLWRKIRIKPPAGDTEGPFRVGETFRVSAEVYLGKLRPDEVEVEFYYGGLKSVDALDSGHAEQMEMAEDRGNGNYLYACTVTCRTSGRYGFTARVMPRGDDWIKFAPGFITWA
ncbi:alpha-glucan family phosphorylase [Desulfobacterales bacterium HSG2]|nr:alpha-glucan family phosphorylase [Desulfobacterales bacterium HSG2]